MQMEKLTQCLARTWPPTLLILWMMLCLHGRMSTPVLILDMPFEMYVDFKIIHIPAKMAFNHIQVKAHDQLQVCDLSIINMRSPGQPITFNCKMLFTCGSVTVDATLVSLTADQVFLGEGATFRNVQPPKAAKVS